MTEFISIVSASLDSFLATYQLAMPDITTNETQFVVSLVGVVANMAGTAGGRQVLLTDPNGKELLAQLLASLPDIPDESGVCLKR